jgi:RNA polymerase sigma-70 factor (ECF subfamily)
MNQFDDISLIAQVTVFKNTKAFDTLVKKYQSPIRRFFLNLTCGNGELSDDLAQETFIKAYMSIATFKNLSSFSTWLYSIAYNVFYDYIRTRKETTGINTCEVDTMYRLEQENIGQKIDIYQSLKILKEIEQTCIILFYMEDININKIAGIVGCPLGTIKSHLSRAKEKLAIYLKQNGYDGSRR